MKHARHAALAIATILGCLFAACIIFAGWIYFDNGRSMPMVVGAQAFIGAWVSGLSFLAFCILFRFFGAQHGKAWRTVGLAVCLLALAFLGYFAGNAHRFQVAATLWHWRNGDFVALEAYRIQVPAGWVVFDSDSTSALLEDGARGQAHGGVVSVSQTNLPSEHQPGELGAWESWEKGSFQRAGSQLSLHRTFQVGSEVVVCRGALLSGAGRMSASELAVLRCMSGGGLLLNFTGPRADIPRFYAIVQGIRRR